MGVKNAVLKEVIDKNNISYRINAKDSINITIKNHVNSIETQTASSKDFSETYREKVDYLQNDFEEFKRFVTSEMSALKSIFSSPNDFFLNFFF